MKISLFLVSISIFLIGVDGCVLESENVSKRPQNSQGWKLLEGGLFIHEDGRLGFPTDIVDALGEQENTECPNYFLTTFGYDDTTQLKSVIDLSTFEALDDTYCRDKNNVYFYYAICSGGYFNILGNQPNKLKVLDNCYAIYDTIVFHCRRGKIDADYKTFKTLGPLARDKDGYFEFGERTQILDVEAIEEYLQEKETL